MEEKNKYNGMGIETLEKMVEDYRAQSRDSQRVMVEILIYLEANGRYKENKRYATSMFKQYIEDRFWIKFNSYQEMKYAYMKFPKHSGEYGIGIVSRVVNHCGRIKAKKVLEKIDAKRAALKNELPIHKINQIIEENANPKIEKSFIDWRAMYEAEKKSHDATRESLKEALETIDELRCQVIKLKNTVARERGESAIPQSPETIQSIHA